ncbi:MAG: tRNA (adenosine(37)-N6)-threonylcarbamoyltransferase complex ATPase subunit type 1 TsaE [Thermoanaerobaculales bacterium]
MTPAERHRTASAEATEDLGQDLARRLRAGDLVLLEGELAAGKTTFARGVLRGLGGDPDEVSSPTFVLLQTYDCSAWGITCLHHVDLYRLGDDLADLREVGLEEVLSDLRAAVVVEWPKGILATWLPDDARTWRVVITAETDDARRIEIIPPENQF